MTERLGIQDAVKKISVAKVGSLIPEMISLEYLMKLQEEIDKWRDQVKEAIMLWPDSGDRSRLFYGKIIPKVRDEE